ncbi:hypothetical protein CBR_g48384 [Chara braunii]|uniref:Aldehyde dehydrogenase domain-containing protein n=1 Tax=Chara braunii TaxID=69332 RepID=A0A388M2J8_CHABU|nr:hypothetical protein CBR_g48384 [Chara braunii]|eukprot:GBG88766.1 hypothetical protein CBR_g48384 [Chara braunii]
MSTRAATVVTSKRTMLPRWAILRHSFAAARATWGSPRGGGGGGAAAAAAAAAAHRASAATMSSTSSSSEGRLLGQRQRRRFSTFGRRFSTFEVVNPTTEEVIAEIDEDSPASVIAKYEKLAGGVERWRKTPIVDRKAVLLLFNELLLKHVDKLASVLTAEIGKPITQARQEIRASVQRVRYFIDHAEAVLQEELVHQVGRLSERIVYEPLGVVAHICSWNYPYFISSNVVAAALVTGNTVLFKPSEQTTLSGQLMEELLHEAGVPGDAFILTKGGRSTGETVASLQGLGGLYFTGSYPTGVRVAELAAPHLVKLQLELGGKDAVYVRHDVADVAAAAATIADGAFYNCGQSCCSVERIYVDRSVSREFLESLARNVNAFKQGDPMHEATYLGPVARGQHLAFLREQLQDALTKGASVVVGGDIDVAREEGSGFFFPPTVLTNVHHGMKVMREETFGPLVGVQVVDGDDQAVDLMRDTEYGLTAGVFTRDKAKAEAILRDLEVGTGYWNCCDRVSPRLPWSGRKNSGVGCTLSMEGLRSFLKSKALHLYQPAC